MAQGDWRIYKRLLAFVVPYWPLMLISIIGFLAAAGAEGYFAQLFGQLIDSWEQEIVSVAYSIPVIMIGVTLVRATGTVIGESLISRVSFNVVFNIRERLFNQTLKLPSTYFDLNTQAHVVSRITFTVAQLRDTGTDALKTVL